MNQANGHPKGECKIGCPGCLAGRDGLASDGGGLAGRRLVAVAAVAMLVPLALAVAGAALAGPDPVHCLLGAISGLAVGAVAGVVVSRLLTRARKKQE